MSIERLIVDLDEAGRVVDSHWQESTTTTVATAEQRPDREIDNVEEYVIAGITFATLGALVLLALRDDK